MKAVTAITRHFSPHPLSLLLALFLLALVFFFFWPRVRSRQKCFKDRLTSRERKRGRRTGRAVISGWSDTLFLLFFFFFSAFKEEEVGEATDVIEERKSSSKRVEHYFTALSTPRMSQVTIPRRPTEELPKARGCHTPFSIFLKHPRLGWKMEKNPQWKRKKAE